MMKRKKTKKYLILENLDSIISLEQLNDTQRLIRKRLLIAIADDKEDYLRLDKEFDIDRTKKFLYEAGNVKLKLWEKIDVYFWFIKTKIVNMFCKIKNKRNK